MAGVYIILAIVILFVIIILSLASNNHNAEDKMQNALASLTDFNATKSISNGTYFNVSIDEEKQEIFCYANSKYVRFKYNDIVSVEFQVDSDIVSSKSASLGGAVAGGIIAGGVGAVIGGSSMGKTISKKRVSSIIIHILLRNSNVDSFDINCMSDFTSDIATDHPWYKEAYDRAQQIYDALRLAMDKVKEDTIKSHDFIQQKSNIEELKELAELKNQGVITEEEFSILKAKIISK